MKRSSQRFVTTTVITTTIGVITLMALPAAGQPLAPPPGGPQLNSPENAPNNTPDDAEVYTRGPLHEAFATPNSTEPVEGPLVIKAPPEPIDELPPDQQPEGDNIMWIPGYWTWDAELEDYLWVSGVWRDVPPGRRWIPGYWAPAEGGSRWVPGMWVADSADELAYLPAPPPSQERGPSVASPGEDYFWTPGNWDYIDAGYRWRPGYWAPLQQSWIWIPPRYVATPFGYVFVPGYWDYVLDQRGVVFAPVRFHHVPVDYTPVVVVNTWQNFWVHLFVNPRHNVYCFGDYYGPRYASAGFVPWYDYHGRGRGYDPLFVYNNWRYGSDFSTRLRGWNQYYTAHADLRPRATYRDQHAFAARHRDDPGVVQNVALALNDVVKTKEAPLRFTPVSRDRRTAIERDVRTFKDFNRERTQTAATGRRFDDDRRAPGERGAPAIRLPQSEQLRGRRSEAKAPIGPPASRQDARPGLPGAVPPQAGGRRDRDGDFDRDRERGREQPRVGPSGTTPGAAAPRTQDPRSGTPRPDSPRTVKPGDNRPGVAPGGTLPGNVGPRTEPRVAPTPNAKPGDGRRNDGSGAGTPRNDGPGNRPGLPGGRPRPDVRGQSPDSGAKPAQPGTVTPRVNPPTIQPRPTPRVESPAPALPRTNPGSPPQSQPGTPPRTQPVQPRTQPVQPKAQPVQPKAQPVQPRVNRPTFQPPAVAPRVQQPAPTPRIQVPAPRNQQPSRVQPRSPQSRPALQPSGGGRSGAAPPGGARGSKRGNDDGKRGK